MQIVRLFGQSQTALSTTKAEYISLSTALCETIPLITLLDEINDNAFDDDDAAQASTILTLKCTVFEDNLGALELATVPKMRPCTKHINVRIPSFPRMGIKWSHQGHASSNKRSTSRLTYQEPTWSII